MRTQQLIDKQWHHMAMASQTTGPEMALHVIREQVRLLTPLEDLTLYTWNTHTARDYFCPNCGILPFRRPRTARAGEWGINVRCLEDIDLDAIPIKRVFGSRLS